MSLIKNANLIIYRIRQKGLEVFLVNSELEDGQKQWQIPQGSIDHTNPLMHNEDRYIALDPIASESGQEEAYAVEGDWHDIPSLKSLIMEDARFMKDNLMDMMGEMEKHGTYFAVKEAFKKVMPEQYEFLKELKDIISDRNSVKDL